MEGAPHRRRPLFGAGWPSSGAGLGLAGWDAAGLVLLAVPSRGQALDPAVGVPAPMDDAPALAGPSAVGGEVVREVAVIAPFTGVRRPRLTKTCACGCGEQFASTFPAQKFKNEAHKKRYHRKMSRHVQG